MKVLLVDDQKRILVLLEQFLQDEGYEVETAEDGFKAIEEIKKNAFDLVITDLKMSGKDGISVLKETKSISPRTEVIIMTAFSSNETAVTALKEGAYDYLIKPFENNELNLLIKRVEEKQQLKKDNIGLKEKLETPYKFDNIIGKSANMCDVFDQVKQVAPTNTTVLILGESGTGKELISKAIHYNSPKRDKPFMAVHCAAMVETLLESELFGHEKGAFTGAHTRKLGRFELAKGGSIFLDEIGEIAPSIQVKLLRVLQEREFFRVGGESVVKADVRVITATNKDLEQAVKKGEFREDLFYRLNVFPITLPPLRQRQDDIPGLVRHFMKKFGQEGKDVKNEVIICLMQYKWPGNLRELENVMERAMLIAGDGPITIACLPGHIRQPHASPISVNIPDEGISLERIEYEYILKAIEKAEGNKSKAAKLLGITRRALYSRMERFERGISPEVDEEDDEDGM
ncbi:MAG: sigma-54 dependent transcriptional regulator [bacterium]|nr:sigma-54 dependent transcriptional regulator [bacterium]